MLQLIAAGTTFQEIANELVIDDTAVRLVVSNLYDKIGITNRTEAGSYAARNRLVSPLPDKPAHHPTLLFFHCARKLWTEAG